MSKCIVHTFEYLIGSMMLLSVFEVEINIQSHDVHNCVLKQMTKPGHSKLNAQVVNLSIEHSRNDFAHEF